MPQSGISRRDFCKLTSLLTAGLAMDWGLIQALAATAKRDDQRPALVIGAGLGGLCCGAYLAKHGVPVTVVEPRNIGGYATTFARRQGQFSFEVSLHGMPAQNNVVAKIFKDLSIAGRVHLKPLPEVYQLRSSGMTVNIPHADPDGFARNLTRHFPDERAGIEDFIRRIIAIAAETQTLHQKGRPPALLFPFKYPNLTRCHTKTLQELMDDHFADQMLQTLLASLWDFHGLPPSRLSAIYYAMNIGDILKHGTCCIPERSTALSTGLARVIHDHGGSVLLDRSVRSILIRESRVEGLELDTGEKLKGRTVISNASPLTTFHRLLQPHDVPQKTVQDLNAYRPSLSTFIVWIGLTGRVTIPGDPGGIHVLSGQDPESDYQNCLKGDIRKVPFRISLFDNMARQGSPQGSSTLRLFCLCGFEPWETFEQDYFAGRKRAYEEQKDTWTRILITRSEEILGPLRSRMAMVESSTPLTNIRFTGNPRGAVYGYEQTVDNAVYHRVDHRTPIQGLYLASAWCRPGGGFSGALMTGELAFRKILEDWASGT